MKTNKLTTIAYAMMCIISAFSSQIILAQEPAKDLQRQQEDQQKVVAVNPDKALEFVNKVPKSKTFLYTIKGASNYRIPSSVGLDQYNFICHKNCQLKDAILPAKLLREVFTIDELTMLQNKHFEKDGFMQIELTLNGGGKIIDMALIMTHLNNADIMRVLTPQRIKQLYIKLRDNLTYQMPYLDNRITKYIRNFFVYFKDVLMNKPMLCTNAPRQTK